jgi:signal transduction histidine kinase
MKRDISMSLAGILMSPPKFGPIAIKSSVAQKINALMESSKGSPLKAVAFFNADGGTIFSVRTPDAPKNWMGMAGKEDASGRFRLTREPCGVLLQSAGIKQPTRVVLGTSEDVIEVMDIISRPVLFDGENEAPDSGLAAQRLKRALKSGKFKEKTVARIAFLVDMGFMRDAIAHDLWKRSIALAFCVFAVTVLTVSIFNLNRNVKLRILLEKEREENLRAQETRLMAAGLAHDIKNPLNLVRGVAKSITGSADSAEVRKKTSTIMDEVDRVNSRLDKFLAYSNPAPPKIENVDLRETLHDVAAILEADCDERNIDLRISVPAVEVKADRQAVEQIFFNLIHNAINAVGRNGRISVLVPNLPRKNGDRKFVAVDVADNGPGVPENAVEDIFKPYFSLTPSGTGLGLAMVKRLCSKLGWSVEYIDNDGGGAIFRVDGMEKA